MVFFGIIRTFIVLLGVAKCQKQGGVGTFDEWQKRTIKTLDESIEKNMHARTAGMQYFDVEFESQPEAMSAHTLRPQDIDIVGAMGDSISAGTGAENGDLSVDARRVVFSAGGAGELEDSLTVPNILKKFNRHVDGYSTENGPLKDKYPYGFNVAVPGARSHDMLSQAETLIDLLKTDNRTDFGKDWKLLTIFIGGNDLCAIGRDPQGASPDAYVKGIQDALDLLHSEVPRMFVNVVDIMEIYVLPDVAYGEGSTRVCRVLQRVFCGYVTTAGEGELEKIKQINKMYQSQLQDLINSGRYDTREDFTVVIQPFFRETHLPYTESGKVDASYFSSDCFHFSDIGHAVGALNLWNNMLEPIGQKTTYWEITDLKVPTEENPYFFTSKNSYVQQEYSRSCPVVIETNETPQWAIISVTTLAVVNVAALVAIVALIIRKNNKKKQMAKTIAEKKNGVDNNTLESHPL